MGQEDSLKKEMTAHSGILAWETPWTEPGGLQSKGMPRDRHDLETTQQKHKHITSRANGQTLYLSTVGQA